MIASGAAVAVGAAGGVASGLSGGGATRGEDDAAAVGAEAEAETPVAPEEGESHPDTTVEATRHPRSRPNARLFRPIREVRTVDPASHGSKARCGLEAKPQRGAVRLSLARTARILPKVGRT
jgi:hypothetical protein